VRVVGIDLAASPANTAVAVLDGPNIAQLTVGADGDSLVELCRGADKIGIDSPLGWPQAFLDFVIAQAQGDPLPPTATVLDRAALAYRVTDLRLVRDAAPLRPLSVSADRIAHVAFRCASVFARLDPARDRSGHGLVVETYPAGSLLAWGLPYRRYKGRDGRGVRGHIVTQLGATFDLGAHELMCLDSDHALDAVVAGLSAAAAAAGAATLPAEADIAVARAEGWIALPTCTLGDALGMLDG
jgi:predicted nuclease with RNAse H fold